MDRDEWRWIKGQEKGERGNGERRKGRGKGKEKGKGGRERDSERRKEKGEKIKRKKNNRYFPKIAMLFGVAPSAKNNDFTARLRHVPSFFFFLRHLLLRRCSRYF